MVAYADPSMRLAVLGPSSSSASTLSSLLPLGREALNRSDCTSLPNGGTMIVSATIRCYELTFAEDVWQSLFVVNATGAARVAFFAQHVPTKFENTAHYLKDSVGGDVEPVAEVSPPPAPAPGNSIPWGEGIGAALLVNLITFSGVVFLAPGLHALVDRNGRFFRGLTSAFASGALLAAAFYLLLFEATHLIATKGTDESVHTFWWGTMILLGILTSFVVDTLCSLCLHASPPDAAPISALSAVASISVSSSTSDTARSPETNERSATSQIPPLKEVPAVVRPGECVLEDEPSQATRVRVLSGVLVGDFMHNLCDGIFIGTAFRHCSSSLAWSITLATVLHELTQELSDYLVLVNPQQGGLKPGLALLLNFVSGISVTIGVVIIFAVDAVDDSVTGMLLAFGGGVYVQIGASECMPRIFDAIDNLSHRLLYIFAFLFGATAIGLVLLDHQHCSSGGGGDGGHGH